jgi:hypothetical protein
VDGSFSDTASSCSHTSSNSGGQSPRRKFASAGGGQDGGGGAGWGRGVLPPAHSAVWAGVSLSRQESNLSTMSSGFCVCFFWGGGGWSTMSSGSCFCLSVCVCLSQCASVSLSVRLSLLVCVCLSQCASAITWARASVCLFFLPRHVCLVIISSFVARLFCWIWSLPPHPCSSSRITENGGRWGWC